jgi:hypothetical protein
VKTEPQTPTEPVKQMIPSDSDKPIRKGLNPFQFLFKN